MVLDLGWSLCWTHKIQSDGRAILDFMYVNVGFGLSGCVWAGSLRRLLKEEHPGWEFSPMNESPPFSLLLVHPVQSHPGFTSGLDDIIFYFTSLPCTPRIHLCLRDFKSLRVSGPESSDRLVCLLLPLLSGIALCLFCQSSGSSLSTVDTERKHLTWIEDSHSVLIILL